MRARHRRDLRLFSAIVPPDEVSGALEHRLATVRPDPSVRWLPRAQWHITLAFYGVDDLRARDVSLTAELAHASAADVALSGAGMFRGVLWVGVDGDLDALATAAGRRDRRAFHAHLTIARWRHATPPASARSAAARLRGWRSEPWRAGQVVLMSSELSHEGARYTVRRRYDLR